MSLHKFKVFAQVVLLGWIAAIILAGSIYIARKPSEDLRALNRVLTEENEKLTKLVESLQNRESKIIFKNKKYYSCEEIKEL